MSAELKLLRGQHPPHQTEVVDENGKLNIQWSGWIDQVHRRTRVQLPNTGYAVSGLPSTGLVALPTIQDLQANITKYDPAAYIGFLYFATDTTAMYLAGLVANVPTWILAFGNSSVTVNLTGQAASIGATNLRINGAVAPAGIYRVSAVLSVKLAQTGAGTVKLLVSWTTAGVGEGTDTGLLNGNLSLAAQGNILPLATATNFTSSGSKVFRHDGTTDITYSTTYVAPGQYDLAIILEKLA